MTPAEGRTRRGTTRRATALSALTLVGLVAGCGITWTSGTPTPTPSPTPSPTVSVEPTPTPTPSPSPSAVALSDVGTFRDAHAGDNGWWTNTMTDHDGDYQWRVTGPDRNPITALEPPSGQMHFFGAPEDYTDVPGVLTFRGNNGRNAASWGSAAVSEHKLEKVWTRASGSLRSLGSTWGGSGWTGQPLLVQWPEATRAAMGLTGPGAAAGAVEVIYPTLSGQIFRMDLATGTDTRPTMRIAEGGFKGTGSIDPRGYPLLYAGQGLPNETDYRMRYHIFDLIKDEEVDGWGSVDGSAPDAGWGGMDSSRLVLASADTLLEPSENGFFISAKLNSSFDAAAKTVSIRTELTRLQYRTPLTRYSGLEASIAAYRNLMYVTDNDGNMLCIDANTLNVLWARSIDDDADATLVLDPAEDKPFLYSGQEVDKRGPGAATILRRIDGLTGKVVWEHSVPTSYDADVNGGLLATPVLGTGENNDLAIFSVAKTTSLSAGTLLALDRTTGSVVWQRELPAYTWSSPILIKTKDEHEVGFLCDSVGICHLFDPRTGTDWTTINVGTNVEASPASFDDMIVVGTRGGEIWGIRVS